MVDLVPPYPGPNRYARRHRHFDKLGGRFSFDAVEDDLGRFFVWDAENNRVVELCMNWQQALRSANQYAREVD